MNKLIDLGFNESANCLIVNDNQLSIEISENRFSRNVLYAFVICDVSEISDWKVRYIGHTRKTFANRMYGYQMGNGIAVNNRVHNDILENLRKGKRVVVYCLPDLFNMSLHDLHIDVSAGLEYSLIDYYCNFNQINNHPALLNIAGNSNYTSLNANRQELIVIESGEEETQYIQEETSFPAYNVMGQFHQTLAKTYWNSPYINIPKNLSNYFTEHGDSTTLTILQNDNIVRQFSLIINRNATENGSPRFYFPGEDGRWFQQWKRSSYRENDTITFSILGNNTLAIIL